MITIVSFWHNDNFYTLDHNPVTGDISGAYVTSKRYIRPAPININGGDMAVLKTNLKAKAATEYAARQMKRSEA